MELCTQGFVEEAEPSIMFLEAWCPAQFGDFPALTHLLILSDELKSVFEQEVP